MLSSSAAVRLGCRVVAPRCSCHPSSLSLSARRRVSSFPYSANHRAEFEQLGSAGTVVADTKDWQLFVSLLIERHPIVTPPPAPVEQEYEALVDQMEAENSYLSAHELWEKEYQEKMTSGQSQSTSAAEVGEKVLTPVDYAYIREQEMKSFEQIKPSLLTDADKSGDEQSLERALHRKLVCVVRQRMGDPKYASGWILPQTPVGKQENLRQAAERLSTELFGPTDAWCHVLGNAPAAHFGYKYPRRLAHKTSRAGGMVFIYRARLNYQLWSPQPSLHDRNEFVEHKWLTHDAAHSLLKSNRPAFAHKVNALLFE